MNDFASVSNSAGLLKDNYDPGAETLEALKRRQKAMQAKVQFSNPNPSIAGLQQQAEDKE